MRTGLPSNALVDSALVSTKPVVDDRRLVDFLGNLRRRSARPRVRRSSGIAALECASLAGSVRLRSNQGFLALERGTIISLRAITENIWQNTNKRSPIVRIACYSLFTTSIPTVPNFGRDGGGLRWLCANLNY